MRTAIHLTIGCLTALVALTGAEENLLGIEPDCVINGAPDQAEAVVLEDPPPLFESMYLPYEGYGSVSILSDGLVIVRIDGDAPSNDGTEASEPLVSYLLSISDESLFLLDVSGPSLTDWRTSSSEQNELPVSDISTIANGEETDPESSPRQRTSLLEIKGDMVFDLRPEQGFGYLDMRDSEAGRILLFELAVENASNPDDAQPLGGGGHCCVMCPNGYCTIWCSFFGIFRHAVCYCAPDGTPVCECVGGPGHSFQVEVADVTDVTVEVNQDAVVLEEQTPSGSDTVDLRTDQNEDADPSGTRAPPVDIVCRCSCDSEWATLYCDWTMGQLDCVVVWDNGEAERLIVPASPFGPDCTDLNGAGCSPGGLFASSTFSCFTTPDVQPWSWPVPDDSTQPYLHPDDTPDNASLSDG